MAHRLYAALILTAAGVVQLTAAPIFSVQSGGITIGSQNLTTAGTQALPWTLTEGMTAAGVLRLTDTDGTPLQSPTAVVPFSSGNWFSKTVTNNSAAAWTSFELELQEILGTPSPDGDGLSFAQGGGLVFSSDRFATITRIDTTRDYLNFSGGSVAPGASVTFRFAVTDNSPQSNIFMAQTPNKADVPEPATLGLMGLALTLTALITRRRIDRK